ncbi:MAG: hypothetical protein ACK5X8_13045 [Planctomyces sp.]
MTILNRDQLEIHRLLPRRNRHDTILHCAVDRPWLQRIALHVRHTIVRPRFSPPRQIDPHIQRLDASTRA